MKTVEEIEYYLDLLYLRLKSVHNDINEETESNFLSFFAGVQNTVTLLRWVIDGCDPSIHPDFFTYKAFCKKCKTCTNKEKAVNLPNDLLDFYICADCNDVKIKEAYKLLKSVMDFDDV